MLNNTLQLITIDRRSTVPYSLQIKETIKGLILERTLYYKAILPTSVELSNHLQIPQKQVEQAYHELTLEHYIKEEDHEYHVSFIQLTNYFFERNTSIVDAVKTLGLEPSITCLEKNIVSLTDEQRIQMGFPLDEDNRYLYINRIYYGDHRPIIILENYIPLAYFPDMEHTFKGHEGLNNFIQEHYGFSAHSSKRITKIVNLTKELAELLNEPVNTASLQSTNQVFDNKGRLIDFGQSHSISSYYFQAIISTTERQEYIHSAFRKNG